MIGCDDMNKENKKGFTLVELLAVIVVIAIISTIGTIGISSIINTSKTKAYDQQVANIIKAAKQWSLENTDKLPEDYNDMTCIFLTTLKSSGNLTEVPKNPISGSEMIGAVSIKCSDVNCMSYNYKYHNVEYVGCY